MWQLSHPPWPSRSSSPCHPWSSSDSLLSFSPQYSNCFYINLDKELESPVCYKLIQPRLMANHAKYWNVDSDIGVECPQCEREFVAHKIFCHLIESHT